MTPEMPSLNLPDWQATRDTLHQYARILGKVRGRYAHRTKHWWHITLTVSARGLTTAPFPVGGRNLELTLDLTGHRLRIDTSDGFSAGLPLSGRDPAGLCRQLIQTAAAAGIELEEALLAPFDHEAVLPYDAEAASRYRTVINWVDAVFKEFKAGLRQETSPVQLFPHHMDLSLNGFSGRRVPGVDPSDEENADEQIGLGFVTGDGSIDNAYFYATAYPVPDGWTDLPPPKGAYWHTTDWVGAILPYATVREAPEPRGLLLEYLRSVHEHGARLMA